MKNYINYINESKDYQEEYDKDTLSYKLQTALDKAGDNDKEIRELIGDFDDIDYTYEYNRARWGWKSETDQLTIIFEPEDNDEVAELVGLGDGELFDYLHYLSAKGANEFVDLEDLHYKMSDSNRLIMKNIFKEFNINYTINDEELLRYFFIVLDDYKKIEKIKDSLLFHIDQFVYENKVNMANKEYHKLNFFIVLNQNEKNEYYIEFVFDLKKVKNFKVNTLYEYFQLNENITWETGGYDIDEEIQKDLDKNTKEDLEELLKLVKEKKQEILDNAEIKYNVDKIKKLGGDILKHFMSYEFQEKFIDNKAENLNKLILDKIVNKKIMEDFGYLLDLEKFNI